MAKWKDIFLDLVGISFILIGLVAILYGLIFPEIAHVLWLSYTILILTGLGMVLRRSYLIASQLAIISIPYIIWNIDFFYILITGNSLWGITDYFFTPRKTLAQLISLQHVLIIPVALFSIYLIKLRRRDFWKFSLGQVVVFFVLTKLFTSPERNINCVFENCLPFNTGPIPYTFAWFLAYIIIIGLTSFVLVKLFYSIQQQSLNTTKAKVKHGRRQQKA